jgi:dTDP-4-dehydrorhamnose 3,5-epimerase
VIEKPNLELLNHLRHKYSDPSIPQGIKAFTNKKFNDERGFFQPDLNSEMLRELGFESFFQKNISKSKTGVIRGMHWQSGTSAQTKIVYCLQGSVIDVVIDLRMESKTYGSINSFKLNANDPNYLKIPSGFAHGFQALEENTLFAYWVDAPFEPNREMSITPLSEEIDSYWESFTKIVNSRDRNAPTYKEFFSADSNRIAE